MLDVSSANQVVKVVLDNNENEPKESNPRHLTTSGALQHSD